MNAFLVGFSWVFTITMILLPRWAWFNPDMGSGIFGEYNAMRGLFWTCGTVSGKISNYEETVDQYIDDPNSQQN